jgi:hypothetical protein
MRVLVTGARMASCAVRALVGTSHALKASALQGLTRGWTSGEAAAGRGESRLIRSDALEPLAQSGGQPTVALHDQRALGDRIRNRQATRHEEGQRPRVTAEHNRGRSG